MPERDRPGHESGDYPPPPGKLGDRVTWLEAQRRADRKIAAKEYGEVLAACSRIERAVGDQAETVEEARDAAREASAQCGELGRRMDRIERDIERERDQTDRHAAVPTVYRESPSSPIAVTPFAGQPGEPPSNDAVQIRVGLSGKQVAGLIAVLVPLVAALTKLIDSALAGGGG